MTHSFPTRRSSDLSLRRRKIRTVLRQAQHKRKRGRVSFARHERKDEARHALAMRPEILNPLFAALTDLKGVGTQLAKPMPRLGRDRVHDVLYHMPPGLLDRNSVV